MRAADIIHYMTHLIHCIVEYCDTFSLAWVLLLRVLKIGVNIDIVGGKLCDQENFIKWKFMKMSWWKIIRSRKYDWFENYENHFLVILLHYENRCQRWCDWWKIIRPRKYDWFENYENYFLRIGVNVDVIGGKL